MVPNRISDPYSLPCGHTFCLRPCLLAHSRAVTARCIHCRTEYRADELQPNYSIGAKLYLYSSEKQHRKAGDSLDGEGYDTPSAPTVRCFACRRSVTADQMSFCHHCRRNICQQCSKTHFDSVSTRSLHI